MGYHPRIETTNLANLTTIRSRNSELWFVNNSALEQAILGYLAKYVNRHNVKLYAFAVEGNHMHGTALFPKANRAYFMRDLNSSVARAVIRHVPTFPGGRFWARRYSAEYLPESSDVETKFFYTVLQPVQDGLVDRISDYPGYNCFRAAACGIVEKYKVVNWGKYNDARRWNADVKPSDFEEKFELRYDRLPGHDNMTPQQYRSYMYQKLEEYRQKILKKRTKPAAGPELLAATKPGMRPRHTKTSTRYSFRPRILCGNPPVRSAASAWYFDTYYAYRAASARYRRGELDVEFPPGTYKPPIFTVACSAPQFS